MEKQPLNKRKKKIVKAVIEIITEKGIEQATLREIAARAGVTTGAIYHHYKNKDELFQDVIDDTMHLVYAVKKGEKDKTQRELLQDVMDAVALRISSLDEQKLHLLVLNDVMSKKGEALEKYKDSYVKVIKQTGDMYNDTLGVENEKYKYALGAILVAALDGIAIQQTLGVLPEGTERMIDIVNSFFAESIPAYFKKHK